MSIEYSQVNVRMPTELKTKIEYAVADKVAKKEEASLTKEIVNRLELTFDLSKADGYNFGYRDATAHFTFAITAALQDKGMSIHDIQTVVDETMANFSKNT
jgi:hypothetical protein